MIPLDGTVLEGEAMVNQAALTGEAMPVRKAEGSTLYAGTVVEEGECVFIAKAEGGSNRYDKIVAMIEESESSSPAPRTVRWCWPTSWCHGVWAQRWSPICSPATPPAPSPA